MLIILSDLVNMCKIEKNTYFQTRSEKLNTIHNKKKIIYMYIGRHHGCLSTGYLEHLSHPSFRKGGAVLEI